jgi:hypothetical protein
MAVAVMVAAEGSNGVRPDSGCLHSRLLADAAQHADWPPSYHQDIPGFWG